MPDTILEGDHFSNLVEIGSVVSEKIFFNFIPPFSIFSLAAILVGSREHRTQFGRGPSKDHSTKVWLAELNLTWDPMGNSHNNLLF
jgi:hypothetical protein